MLHNASMQINAPSLKHMPMDDCFASCACDFAVIPMCKLSTARSSTFLGDWLGFCWVLWLRLRTPCRNVGAARPLRRLALGAQRLLEYRLNPG